MTRLERSMKARRERVIEAVLELARSGGYDAVQIRAVSEQSDVATDTIYRYFGSRDALISTALIDWLDHDALESAPNWFEGDTAAEKLLAACRHSWTVWEHSPNLLETFVRVTLAEGSSADGPAARARGIMMPLVGDILRDIDAEYCDDLLMMLEHFTYSAMSSVVQDRLAIEDVFPLLERTVRRLSQHPAMAKHRPAKWEWKPETRARRSGD